MIVSCGEALVDMVPDAVPGGGPMNVAIAAARLGAPTAFVGGISNDAYGDLLWQHLEANGVDVRPCQRHDAPTARAIVQRDPELSFRFEGTHTADTLLDAADLSMLGPGPRIVHGGTLGMFRGRTADTLARLVACHDGLVSLDPNIRPEIIDDRDEWDRRHARWLTHTDIYKASDDDLSWIWPDRSHESAARTLISEGVSAVVITRGAAGLSIVTADGEVEVGSPRVDVVDAVGAGDTIVAAVLASILELGAATSRAALRTLQLSDWKMIAQRSVGAAAITCSRRGADPPYRAELDW